MNSVAHMRTIGTTVLVKSFAEVKSVELVVIFTVVLVIGGDVLVISSE